MPQVGKRALLFCGEIDHARTPKGASTAANIPRPSTCTCPPMWRLRDELFPMSFYFTFLSNR